MADLEERVRNRTVMLAGQFTRPVRIEAAWPIGMDVYMLRVRHANGVLDEAQATVEELEAALAGPGEATTAVDPGDLFLWVEAQRIRLSFAHDPLFAVSMSGVRGLPHQIEAVYRHMLPQPRLRFVLADDPEVDYPA